MDIICVIMATVSSSASLLFVGSRACRRHVRSINLQRASAPGKPARLANSHKPKSSHFSRDCAGPYTPNRLISLSSTKRGVESVPSVSSEYINNADIGEFFANPTSYPDFESLGITSSSLLRRLEAPPLNLKRPSAVQASAYDIILRGQDTIVGAETGSGKTFAYLIPLVEDVLRRKREWREKVNREEEGEEDLDGEVINREIMDPGYDYARAIILVPNKELAYQAARMAATICGGIDRCVIWGADALTQGMDRSSPLGDAHEEDIVRLALLPGGLSNPLDFPPFRFAIAPSPSKPRQPPPDLIFATPANLSPFAHSPKNIDLFSDVASLVVDEADMLLDGGYVRELNNVLMGFRRADRLVDRYDTPFFRKIRKKKESPVTESNEDDDTDDWFDDSDEGSTKKKMSKTQHIFVAATLPDFGLRSVDAYLNRKFPDAVSITMKGMHNARHYGLEDQSQTVWNELTENKDRMKRLVDVLKLDRSEVGPDGRGLQGEKVMIFLNSVNDVDGATNGLRRAGINAVPYHAKIPLQERSSNLDQFRRYRAPSDGSDDQVAETVHGSIPVLICTDLASRGLDIPGVTAVVQLQFALNVVSHLHRMGRCGRAGNRDGRGIIFYGSAERELVQVVREAEIQQSRMTLTQDVEEDIESPGTKKNYGKVEKAFSRKRGFTKKRKKEKRREI